MKWYASLAATRSPFALHPRHRLSFPACAEREDCVGKSGDGGRQQYLLRSRSVPRQRQSGRRGYEGRQAAGPATAVGARDSSLRATVRFSEYSNCRAPLSHAYDELSVQQPTTPTSTPTTIYTRPPSTATTSSQRTTASWSRSKRRQKATLLLCIIRRHISTLALRTMWQNCEAALRQPVQWIQLHTLNVPP